MVGSLLRWWYGLGWRRQLLRVESRFDHWADYFSFAIILRTLFAPFRQIAAGKVGGPLEVRFRAWADRLFSRVVGLVVRSFVLLFGGVFMILLGFVSLVQLIGWLVLPFAPVIGIVLAFSGWVPWTR